MPIKHYFDYEIRLSETSQHPGLYRWFLQEVTKEGKEVGSPVIPWGWNLWFDASEIRYTKNVNLKEIGFVKDETPELISATLHSRPSPFSKCGAARFSMLGTNREINDFALRIIRLESDQIVEECRVSGIVQYTLEVYMELSIQDDCIEIEVSLTPKNFDELRYLIRDGRPNDDLTVWISGAAGFYSESSFHGRADRIKVLTTEKDDHPLTAPEDCVVQPLRLGAVRGFGLHFNRRTVITLPEEGTSGAVEPSDIAESDNATKEPGSRGSQQWLNDTAFEAFTLMRKSVGHLRIVLWVIAVLIALGLFTRRG